MAFKATYGSGANSFQGFKAFVSRRPPSYNNLYWVRFRGIPTVLGGSAYFNNFFTGNNADTTGNSFGGPGSDEARMLSYYANDVTIPSRQLTTGDAKTVGALYRYPTGTTFSEISINFTLPRALETRMLFERWMNYITEDSGNRVSWYNDSVCPFMDIVKYDRGGVIPTTDSISVVTPTADPRNKNTVKWNQATGVWALSNVYPFNISNVQLTNGTAGTLSMEVSFYYERYRFYQPRNTGVSEVVDNIGAATAITAASYLAAAAASGATATGSTASTTVTSAGSDGKLKS
jgi:hypothetical protein